MNNREELFPLAILVALGFLALIVIAACLPS